MSNDALFAVIAGGAFIGIFSLMIIVTAIYEAIDEAIEKRRNK